MASFEQLMNAFGVVTVMNACIYKLKPDYSYVGRGACIHGDTNAGALEPDNFACTGLYLDTLKIANLTQEGPTKTITGGQYANPLLKYGKTMTLEMQDALGRAPVLTEFFGCDYDAGVLSVTDKFPGPFAIEGDTFLIDQKTGDQVPVHILIPQFLPDAILTLTQDAEGDAAVFDLNGSVGLTKIMDNGTEKAVFYQIRETSWFHPNGLAGDIGTAEEAGMTESDYHDQELSKLYPIYVTGQTDGVHYELHIVYNISSDTLVSKSLIDTYSPPNAGTTVTVTDITTSGTYDGGISSSHSYQVIAVTNTGELVKSNIYNYDL